MPSPRQTPQVTEIFMFSEIYHSNEMEYEYENIVREYVDRHSTMACAYSQQ
jgi:hypothetical protein